MKKIIAVIAVVLILAAAIFITLKKDKKPEVEVFESQESITDFSDNSCKKPDDNLSGSNKKDPF